MNVQGAISELAPNGVLRAGINLSNFLLVTGKDSSGAPVGVAPDMARAIADRLEVNLTLTTFSSPGELADAAGKDVWDIGLIAAEPVRAEAIAFSAAYVEIEATYMVRNDSMLGTIADVDRPGVRIAVSERSAYDLYLTRNLEHASLVRAKGLAAALDIFQSEGLDALAGLRPGLIDDAGTGHRFGSDRVDFRALCLGEMEIRCGGCDRALGAGYRRCFSGTSPSPRRIQAY